MNAFLSQEDEWHGAVIDIGGSVTSSYQALVPTDRIDRLDIVNINTESGANILADASAIPVPDAAYDRILCLNLLEHVPDPYAVMRESFRILRSGGDVIVYIPFLVRVHPDPYDYQRLTPQGMERMFRMSGFTSWDIRLAAGGPFIAGISQIQPLLPRLISIPLLWIAFVLDGFVIRLRPAVGTAFPVAIYAKCRK